MQAIAGGAEKILVNFIRNLKTGATGWMMVHFHFASYRSYLQQWNRDKDQLRIAYNNLNNLLAKHEGRIFVCYDGDVYVLSNELHANAIAEIVNQIDYLFDFSESERAKLAADSVRLAKAYYLEQEWERALNIALAKLAEFKDYSTKQVLRPADRDRVPLEIPEKDLLLYAQEERSKRREPLIMLADDDKLSLRLASNVIQPMGRILTAQSGEEAIEIYKKTLPDILFLDINMPGLSGHQVLDYVRRLDSHSFVVMFSANGYAEEIKKCQASGARGFVVKPFTKQKMLDYIEASTAFRKNHATENKGSRS